MHAVASFAGSPFSVFVKLEEQKKKEGRDKEKGEPALLCIRFSHVQFYNVDLRNAFRDHSTNFK